MAATSIVDYLKGNGRDSSYAARKKLAEENGIANYTGTAQQNTQLLNQLQSGAQKPAAGPSNNYIEAPSPNVTAGVTEPKQVEQSPTASQGPMASVKPSTGYTPSERYNDYTSRLADYEGDFDEYVSPYSGQINSILNSIQNRDPFTYDMNNDQLYQQYKDQYMRQGNLAMRDAMGNAAGLTGGYGNSYAGVVGSQAYDAYLQKMNDRIPELYQLAYNQYQDAGQDLYNQLNALGSLEDRAYQQYMGRYNQYLDSRNYYANAAQQEYGNGYNEYADALNRDQWERQFTTSNDQWERQFAYQKEQDAIANQLAMQRAASGGSGGGRSGSGSGKDSAAAEKTSADVIANVAKVAKDTMKAADITRAYDYILNRVDAGVISEDDIDTILKKAGISEEEYFDIIRNKGGFYIE